MTKYQPNNKVYILVAYYCIVATALITAVVHNSGLRRDVSQSNSALLYGVEKAIKYEKMCFEVS